MEALEFPLKKLLHEDLARHNGEKMSAVDTTSLELENVASSHRKLTATIKATIEFYKAMINMLKTNAIVYTQKNNLLKENLLVDTKKLLQNRIQREFSADLY